MNFEHQRWMKSLPQSHGTLGSESLLSRGDLPYLDPDAEPSREMVFSAVCSTLKGTFHLIGTWLSLLRSELGVEGNGGGNTTTDPQGLSLHSPCPEQETSCFFLLVLLVGNWKLFWP